MLGRVTIDLILFKKARIVVDGTGSVIGQSETSSSFQISFSSKIYCIKRVLTKYKGVTQRNPCEFSAAVLRLRIVKDSAFGVKLSCARA